MLATEFKERIEQMSRGQVEVSICDNKDVLIRPAINFNAAPPFVGAAIVEDMANEIYQQLQNGTLSNAANLYKDNQLTEYVQWIIEGC